MKQKIILLLLFFPILAYSQTDSLSMDLAALAKIDSIEQSLKYQHGTVQLGDGFASLAVPEGYKFLDAAQSTYVLTNLWGNPPSDVLGLLFPENISPLSENFTYAVEISYSEEGFIKDKDAKKIKYDELLEQMQKESLEANPERVKAGYEPVELIGWASSPFYDESSKKLHWAKELKFGEAEMNTLNYNIRILGRKGYLNLNAIGDITVLPEVKKDISKILTSVNFNKGYTYEEFNPKLDKVAAYGIGGLIAGKVLAKVGLFAVFLKFWKIIALAVIGGFAAFRKKIFKKEE